MNRKMRKGQVFITDYIIGLLMFFALTVMAVVLIVQIIPDTTYEQLYTENLLISQTLLDAGYPLNWTNETVIFPGIADKFRLNKTKITYFDNLSYEQTQGLLQIPSDYLFFFQNKTHYLNISQCAHGYNITVNTTTCEPLLDTITFNNLVKTTRLAAYNGSVVRLTIYSWN